MDKEFQKYATKGLGLSSMTLDRYRTATDAYINPTIIEERKLNVASMDVFSRLMMDRIIFLGVPIDDDVANIIQAQLLFLASTDSSVDISLYINTPGGQVTSGLATMTPCSWSSQMWLPSVPAWPHRWVRFCFAPARRASARVFLIQGC